MSARALLAYVIQWLPQALLRAFQGKPFILQLLRKLVAPAVISAYCLLTHGLLLLNDGVYWDDWLWLDPATGHVRWDMINAAYRQMGFLPTNAIHLWLFDAAGYRICVFGSILFSSFLVYALYRRLGGSSGIEALSVAMLFSGYPGVKTYVVFSTANYVFYFALFLLAVFLATTPVRTSRSIPHVLRGVAALLFVLSFNLNSLLVFHFAFVALLAMWRWNSRRAVGLTWLLVYASLPVLYWVTKEAFFPRQGEYAAYNQFQHSPVTLGVAAIRFGIAIYGVLQDVLRELLAQPVLVLLAVVLICFVGRRVESKYPDLLRCSSRREGSLIFGIVLLALGMLPYVVVGSAPGADAWSTRNALLVGLPLAVIIVGITGVVETERRGKLSLASLSVLALMIVGFTLTNVRSYLEWQVRWVKDRSIILNLSAMPELRNISVFWIEDESGLGVVPVYRFYEWASIFKKAWGGESHIGFDRRAYGFDALRTNSAYFNRSYNLSGLDRCGQQATLRILKGQYIPDDWTLAFHYFQVRWNSKAGRLNDLLSKVTQVEWRPVSTRRDGCCANEQSDPGGN